MVSFELGKEIEKDVFHLVTSMGQRKFLSPHKDPRSRQDKKHISLDTGCI